MLILCEALRRKAEVAELLETSVASRTAPYSEPATLDEEQDQRHGHVPSVDEADADLLARYVKAFEQYDMEALTLDPEDAIQSMPLFDMWLSGRDDVLTWWFGPGIGCRGSR